MMKKTDVVALGELLIDFTENGVSGQGNPLFEANPGGAPCNVLAILTKLGDKTAFIGKVGDDFFGKQLKSTLERGWHQLQAFVWIKRFIQRLLWFIHLQMVTVIFLSTVIRVQT